MSETTRFYVTGGTIPQDAPCYVTRQADQELFEGLVTGEFCAILTSRQMGKSSLMVRTLARLRASGRRTVALDLTRIGGQSVTPEQWYLGLLAEAGRALGLRREFLAYWQEHAQYSLVQRFFGALTEVALARLEAPIVVFVDEVDLVRSLSFSTDEFFAAVRECYTRRAQDPALNRLTFCLLGTASPADLIQDTRTTPFNIGRRIELNDFTPAEAAPLTQGFPAHGERLLARALFWTGGHPYLTQRLCEAVAAEGESATARTVDRHCEELFLTQRARETDSNLTVVRQRVLRSEADLVRVLSLYDRARAGRRVKDDPADLAAGVLKLSGIVSVERGLLRARNQIYARLFDHRWVQDNLPEAEMRRQRAAYRRGLFRAMAVSLVGIGLVSALALAALRNARVAHRREIQARTLLYIADLNMAQQEWEGGPAGADRLQTLLEETRSAPSRGFEWGYWWRLLHQPRRILEGHTDVIATAAFSPDSRRLVTASFDGTAKVWDVAGGREPVTLSGHTSWVLSAAFSPNGRRVVTGSTDRTAKVWQAATGRELYTLRGHTGGVISAAFSPDGRRVVTASEDGTGRVWEVASEQRLAVLQGHLADVWCAAFSPDGRRVVTGSEDGTVKVWEADSGQLVRSLGQRLPWIRAVSFSTDGKRAISKHTDDTVREWEVATGQEVLTLRGSPQVASTFSPDGRLVAVAGGKVVEVRRADLGSADRTFKVGTGGIRVALSPDGTRLITGGPGEAKVWEVASRKVQLTLPHPGTVTAVAFSADGRRVATGSGDLTPCTAKVWDAATGRLLRTVMPGDFIGSVALSSDGRRLATACNSNLATIWDATTGRPLVTVEHAGSVRGVALSPDGRRLATASTDGTARVWDAATGALKRTLKHNGAVWSVAFSPDGRRVATGCYDCTAVLWDAASGRKQRTLQGHSGAIYSVAFSPDGTRLATGSWDGTAKLWELSEGQEMLTLRGQAPIVMSVAFSGDGRRLATGNWDGTAQVWESEMPGVDAAGRGL